jgi:hypothetical protein
MLVREKCHWKCEISPAFLGGKRDYLRLVKATTRSHKNMGFCDRIKQMDSGNEK